MSSSVNETEHICVECKHAIWSWLLSDCARCKKHLTDTDVLRPVTGKPMTTDNYELCMKVRGCWGHQIKRDGAPSPTCPDYEPRKKPWWKFWRRK